MTRLTIDSFTGEIHSQEELNSGYYEAEVTAKVTINDEELQGTSLVRRERFFLKFRNKLRIISQVKITVLQIVTCPDGNVTVEKSLAIQNLKENEIHRNIFPTKINDCNYDIRSVQPNYYLGMSIMSV